MISNHNNNDSWAPFELVIYTRDAKGNPTDRKKSIKTDKPDKLDEFYIRNVGKPKKKKNGKKSK